MGVNADGDFSEDSDVGKTVMKVLHADGGFLFLFFWWRGEGIRRVCTVILFSFFPVLPVSPINVRRG